MTPHEAANRLRPTFHLSQMPPEDRHHILFVEAVAAQLGVEPTPFNLQQVAAALDEADLRGDDLHFPLMLYSRQHHNVKGVPASTYYPRHDMVFVTVENEEQMQLLGKGWVENADDLPPRGDTPMKADDPTFVSADGSVTHWEHDAGDVPKDRPMYQGFGEAGKATLHSSKDDERPVSDFPQHSEFGATKAYVDTVKEVHSDDTESMAQADEVNRTAAPVVEPVRSNPLPTEADRVAEQELAAAAAESQGYASQYGTSSAGAAEPVNNMGRGSVGDGTSTRPVANALPADNAGMPTNQRAVKNEG